MAIAKDLASSGTPVQDSWGDTLSDFFPYFWGMSPPSGKEDELRDRVIGVPYSRSVRGCRSRKNDPSPGDFW